MLLPSPTFLGECDLMDFRDLPARLSRDPGLRASPSCPLRIQTCPEASTEPICLPFPFTILVCAPQRLPTISGRCLVAARPSSLVSSGKAWGGSRKGVGSCGGQTDPSPPVALAAMGLGLLFPLLLLGALGAPGSELDAGGRHVCKASRWVLWASDEGGGGHEERGAKAGRVRGQPGGRWDGQGQSGKGLQTWGCDPWPGPPDGAEASDSDPAAGPGCPPPPADPSLPHSPSAELQCCPGWRQKDRECTIRE